MYPALAALASELGPAPEPNGPAVATLAVRAYLFRTPHACPPWSGPPRPGPGSPGRGHDRAGPDGNPLAADVIDLSGTPSTSVSSLTGADALRAALQAAQAKP